MNTICFGEILWDILPDDSIPGGAPMNVCYHLNRLKQRASLISKTGNDQPGNKLLDFLQHNEIDTSLVQVDNNYSTGRVIATQKGNEMEYDIVQPVAWDFIDSSAILLNKVAAAEYFVCGSLVARNEHSRKTLFQLLDVAKTKIVDINFRSPHYNREIAEALFHRAGILKLNDHELSLISGWYSNETNFEKQIKYLSEQFSIPTLVITRGEAGASLLYDKNIYHHAGYKVKVVDTIGSGDAFLAGFLSKHMIGSPPEISLEFACRMGAFIASKKGACPAYNIETINGLLFV